MAVRVMAVIGVAAIFAGGGLWAWPVYCEQYGLCHPACRVASNGVEFWKSATPVTAKSGWIAANASPGSECLSLLEVMRKQNTGRSVAIDYVNMANERKPAPFYQYDCTFDIKEPVFAFGRNKECGAIAGVR
jgi:hypothetical protein